MKILLLHTPQPTGTPKQVAVNADEVLRMEEVEGGSTQIIQTDKGPTTVEESLSDILKALGGEVKEVKKQEQEAASATGQARPGEGQVKPGQPIGQPHKGGVR